MDESPNRSRRELALLLKSGPALAIMKGPQSVEVEEVYGRAQKLGTTLGEDAAVFKATWGLWFSANIGRKLEKARDRAQELVTLGQHSTNEDLMLEALHCRWSTAFFRGDVAGTLKDTDEGIKRYDPDRHSWMGPVFGGHDPGVCALESRANVLCLSGLVNQGKMTLDQSVSLAEGLKHPHSLGFALHGGAIMYQLLGDYEAVDRIAQRLVEIAEKYNFPPQRAHALILSGWARAIGDDSAAGLELMEAEYPRASAIGPLFRYYAALLAEARAKFGKVSDALTVLRWALDTVTEPGIGWCVPELYRLQGMCLLRLDPPREEEAITALRMAVDTAKQQGALLFQLKAAINLTEAAGATGSPKKELKSLHDLCASFPDEFEAPQLAHAKRLLA